MGVKEMQIFFDNQWATYYAGGTVSGRMVLKLDSPKKVNNITIKFKGGAEVKWSESESYTDSDGKSQSRSIDYTAHETYFENKFIVFGGSGSSVEIPPGEHVYNFMTMLPPTLPCSFEGEFGHVRYTVKATLDRPWKFDQDSKAAFTVISPLDLNYRVEARAPIMEQREKYVGCCCCKSGPLSVTLRVPMSGFVSGQYIPITLDLENNTNTNVNSVTCALRKVVTFTSKSPSQKTKIQKIDIAQVRLGAVGAHGHDSSTDQILVPALPPSNLSNCSIIDVRYDLKVETKVDGMFFRGLSFSAPVIFGTVPLVQSYGAPPLTPGGAMEAMEAMEGGKGGPTPGWNLPASEGGHVYPDLPPPTYEESQFKTNKSIRDADDNEHTMIGDVWVPRYPTYNFAPSAPSAP